MIHKEMRDYLLWRFTAHLPTKYKILFDEWMSGITEEQMYYFRREKERVIKNGLYRE